MIYEPVDVAAHPAFIANPLSGKRLLVVPSQGETGTQILTGQEGEMLYEHRQEGEAISASGSVFVSRSDLPLAEDSYRTKLFGGSRPAWIVSPCSPGERLDRSILRNETALAALKAVADNGSELSLYGFSQTEEMRSLAQSLSLPYYGNPTFAKAFGGKVGLVDLLKEAGLPSLPTFELREPKAELVRYVRSLRDLGYSKVVVKVDRSTGGLGHLVSSIAEVLAESTEVDRFLPIGFTPEEGAVVQGWIDTADSVSLATFVDFNGGADFTAAQAQLIGVESRRAVIGARPVDRHQLAAMLTVGEALRRTYKRHQAWGPHTMGMVFPTSADSEALHLAEGVPLCIDENARAGASTISKAWILNLRGGRYGIGWIVSRIAVPPGTTIATVIATLDDRKLLIKDIGSQAQGIFVFNGSILDSGHDDAFYAIAISRAEDPEEAAALINTTRVVFGG